MAESNEFLLEGIYGFTERLLVDKFWQDEDISEERNGRQMQDLKADDVNADLESESRLTNTATVEVFQAEDNAKLEAVETQDARFLANGEKSSI